MEDRYLEAARYYDSGNFVVDGVNLLDACNMNYFTTFWFDEYLKHINFEGVKQSRHTESIIINHVTEDIKVSIYEVRASKVVTFKKLLYKFLRVASNSYTADMKFNNWAACNATSERVIKTSANLLSDGIVHSISSSARGGYNIKQSSVAIRDDELMEEMKQLKLKI